MKLQLLVVVLAAGLVAARASAPRSQGRAAEVRDELMAVNAAWDAARTSHDVAAFERMLAPDFWVQIGPQRMTRAEFIAEISRQQPGARLARFESEILTLNREEDVWAAVVEEKLEVEVTGPDGEKKTSCSLWITKDRFRKDGDEWTTLSSEAMGWEGWGAGEAPPFDDWDA
jgi:hypothetical protein